MFVSVAVNYHVAFSWTERCSSMIVLEDVLLLLAKLAMGRAHSEMQIGERMFNVVYLDLLSRNYDPNTHTTKGYGMCRR